MDGGFREWLGSLSRRELALVGLLGLAAVGGIGLWYVRSLPQPVSVHAAPAPEPGPSVTPIFLIVHVAGWVEEPGVYELADGSRVIDALDAAGGPKKGAELSALNLAAPLTDGQQVLVVREAEVPESSGTAETGGVPSGATALVNVNTATTAELETLPGIGEVLAATIVQYREEHGPFTSVDQLEDVSGIGEVTLEELRDLVTV
ncbi:MAG: helix-hairpin-helix domain-containing protein [Actinomycetota bacterium]